MLFLLALEKLEDSERELIGRLYTDYSPKVKKIAKSILHDDRLADDAVNDTFLKVIDYKEKFFDVPETERIRLIIICARSVCFNTYNKNKKICFDSIDSFCKDDDAAVSYEIPDDLDLLKLIVEKETGSYLEEALNGLKSPSREMIILKIYHEMKNVEIAKFYKMKPATVNTIINRSIKYLHRELEEYICDAHK